MKGKQNTNDTAGCAKPLRIDIGGTKVDQKYDKFSLNKKLDYVDHDYGSCTF